MSGCESLAIAIAATDAAAGLYERVKPVEVVAGECQWARPVYLQGDVAGLTDADLIAIAAHNEKIARFCKNSEVRHK